MTKEELIKRLEDIEWEDFEVKAARSAVPQSSWETVSSFSNTAGGWLIFGVQQLGKEFIIQGVENPEKIEQDFITALRGGKFNIKIQTTNKKYKVNGVDILAFHVASAPAKFKPIYFSNSLKNTFIRTGSGDQRATQEEIDAMFRNSSFESKDKELTDFAISDLDEETVHRYRTYLQNIEPAHSYNSLSNAEFLQKLNVLINQKITIAGLLVFGKEDCINYVIPDFRIDYLEIAGTSYSKAPARYKYRLPGEENLFNYYFSVYKKLIKNIDIPFKEGKNGFRDEDQPQVNAVKEALVNLLMHTDYFSNAKPRIRVFTDRIEFFNPGGLPKKLEDIINEDFSMPRNSTIAKIFRIIKLSENIGSGFHKMINGWESYYKVKPDITGDFDSYTITFKYSQAPQVTTQETVEKITKIINENKDLPKKELGVKLGEELGVKLGENEAEVIRIIVENNLITSVELSKRIGISTTAIENNIAKLKKKGILRRVGSDKGGYWEILK